MHLPSFAAAGMPCRLTVHNQVVPFHKFRPEAPRSPNEQLPSDHCPLVWPSNSRMNAQCLSRVSEHLVACACQCVVWLMRCSRSKENAAIALPMSLILKNIRQQTTAGKVVETPRIPKILSVLTQTFTHF
jgi:hypothetical protein